MINWPDSLIDELASRRCVIFIGSGASASAKKRNGENDISPPTWAGLLKLLLERSPEDAIGSKKMQNYFLKNKIISIVLKL